MPCISLTARYEATYRQTNLFSDKAQATTSTIATLGAKQHSPKENLKDYKKAFYGQGRSLLQKQGIWQNPKKRFHYLAKSICIATKNELEGKP